MLSNNSISTKLLKIIITIYFVLTLLLTLGQIFFEYKRYKDYIIEDIDRVVASQQKHLSQVLYGYHNIDIDMVLKHLNIPTTINYVQIFDKNNRLVSPLEVFDKEEYFIYEKDIFLKQIQNDQFVGKVKIYYKKSFIWDRIKNTFIFMVLGAVFKSLLLLWLFLWAFKRYLLDYLDDMTRQLNKIDYDTLGDTRLQIDSNSGELGQFVDKFNEMIDKLNITKQDSITKQNMLVHQNKFAAMGLMIEQIAHQWRQPLNVISGIAGGLKFRLNNELYDKEYFIEELTKTESSTKYLSQTIDDFMSFYKIDRYKDEISLSKTVEINLSIIDNLVKKNGIKLVLSDFDDIEPFKYSNEISHILLNLLSNSIDALKPLQQDEKYIFLDIEIKKDKLKLIVQDNGGGIDIENEDKIFTPYFTTKSRSKGTGLGLYMTHEIVTNHMQGDIAFSNIKFNYNNKEYYGASFTIIINL